MKRYQIIFQQLQQQIQQGTLRPGDTLPSIRSLSLQSGFGKNTIIRAYQELEAELLIEPKDRSGFVVTHQVNRAETNGTSTSGHSKAKASPNALQPKKVQLGALPLKVLAAASDQNKIQFGSAHPAIQHPACRRFYQILARQSYQFANSSKANSHYTHAPGLLALRQQICRRLSIGNQTVSADDLVITNGAQEAVTLSLLATANSGDTIAVETPCFYGTLSCIEALGMKVLEIPSDPSHGINLELLDDALKKWPIKALLLNPNFNNPLGFEMPTNKKQQLLDITKTQQLPIIEDDVFGELYYHNKPTTLKSLDKENRVIYCSSLSKTLHSDIRIGWVAAGKYFEKVNFLKCMMTMASPGVVQYAAADFLKDSHYERHLRRMRSIYQQRWLNFKEALYLHWPQLFTLSEPTGSFLCWVEFPKNIDTNWIFEQADQNNIGITPGSLFSASGQFKNCLRMNFSTFNGDEQQIAALVLIGKLINQAVLKNP
ncbi:PLP-dependent aminotransferase family protein [Pelagibaculum spongiae]|uniref:Transcriptional regulator n=1 Tax=Pelagibaculum spongiae TaxID=2080658 RepID=A0A2V1H3M1_9GAMM|nr:PLP-dependent aminotransferase family protein [Pelagibaculum spongiae]PVZ71818.1 transcriptional regulator [Pelagibaculum spongiae]